MSMPLNYRASHSAVYYTPERKINVVRTVAGFIAAAGCAIAGGFAYAKIQPHLTSIYLRIGQVVLGAVTVGLLGILPVRYGKVRLPVVAAFMGATLALIAVYAMWVAWVHEVIVRAWFPLDYSLLIRRPMALFRLIRFIDSVGAWQLDGNQINGVPLLIFWLGEFAAMLVAGVFMPLRAIGTDDPVCRECRSVCKLVRPIARFAIDRRAELVAAVEAYDFASVLSLPPPHNDVEPQLSLRLVACPQCGQTSVVTVNHLAWSTDSNGRRKLQITPVVNQLLVPAAEAEELKVIVKQLAERKEAPVAEDAEPVASAGESASEGRPADEPTAGS